MSLKITSELIKKIADLSYLELSSAEEKEYLLQFEKILGFIESIKEAKDQRNNNLPDEEKFFERKDEEKGWDQRFNQKDISKENQLQLVLSNAPDKIGTAFQVPKILDQH